MPIMISSLYVWIFGTAARTAGLLGADEQAGSSSTRLSGPLTRSRTSPSSHLTPAQQVHFSELLL
jgi:hypothetical protein